jgi:hypothetical protein
MRKGSKNLLKNKKYVPPPLIQSSRLGTAAATLLHKTKIFLVQMKIAILLRVCITCIHTDFKRPEKHPRMPKKISKHLAILN